MFCSSPARLSLSLLVVMTAVLAMPHVTTRQTQNTTSKAGLGWNNAPTVNITQFTGTGKVSWYYTWSSWPTSWETDLEFVPLFWGTKSIDQWGAINNTISQNNVKNILAMNEPEQPGQSNLSPQDGAILWKQWLEPLHSQGIRLGSPAPSSAPNGKTWLQDFLGACAGGCNVDFIALHWYGINATEFIAYIEDFHNTFQRPLWVTEWDCQNFVDAKAQCSYSDVVNFLNTTQTYMDNSSFVERYSWFGAMTNLQGVNSNNALLDSKGNITALGSQYIGATAPDPNPSSGLPNIVNDASNLLPDVMNCITFILYLTLLFYLF